MSSKIPQHFGRYVIQKEVDRGALSVLYHAEDPASGRLVILKALSPASCFQDVSFRERFYRDAEAAGRLSHPGIISVLEVAENPETRTPYFVMEPVAGDTLDDVLTGAGGKFPAQDALRLASEVAAALEYAHEHGVVHGDLTPENIVVSEDGHAKITGFGVARLNVFKVSTQGKMFCTPAYMAPELRDGNEIDGRCDLFSLGAVLYTLLTGSKPVQASGQPGASSKPDKSPIPASVLNDGVSQEVDFIIGRALEKDPGKRYQRAAEILLDMQDVQEGRVPRSLQNPAPSAQAPVFEAAPAAKVETSAHEVKGETSFAVPKTAVVPETKGPVQESKCAVPEPKQAPVVKRTQNAVQEAKQSPLPSAANAAPAAAATSESKQTSSPQPKTTSRKIQDPAAKAIVAAVPPTAAKVDQQKATVYHRPTLFEQAWIKLHDARVLIALGVALVVVSGVLVIRQRRLTEVSGGDVSQPAAIHTEKPDDALLSTLDEQSPSPSSSDSSSTVKRSKTAAKSKRRAPRNSAKEVAAMNSVAEQAAPQLVLANTLAPPVVMAPVLMSSLNVTVSHRFKAATMYLSVDGNPAGQFDLQGDQSRRLLVLKKVHGESEHAVQVPTGAHRISVRVHSDEKAYDQSAEAVHTFSQGVGSKLMVKFDSRGNLALAFQ